MLTGNHVSSVQPIYDCFIKDDIEGVFARLDENVIWDADWSMAPPPGFASGRGHDVVRAFFAGVAAYEIRQFEPLVFLAGYDWVAVPIRFDLLHTESGRRAADMEVHLWRFGPQGKAVWFRHIIDARLFDPAWRAMP